MTATQLIAASCVSVGLVFLVIAASMLRRWSSAIKANRQQRRQEQRELAMALWLDEVEEQAFLRSTVRR